MNEKRCCDCEHFGLSKDPIFKVLTGICGRCGKEVGYTDQCLFEEERNDDDIKFKLITYVDTDFEAKTQKCEYFIELEDGVERSLKDILIENVKLKEQQATIKANNEYQQADLNYLARFIGEFKVEEFRLKLRNLRMLENKIDEQQAIINKQERRIIVLENLLTNMGVKWVDDDE